MLRRVICMLLAILFIFLSSCVSEVNPTAEVVNTQAPNPTSVKREEIFEASVLAVGDIMFHLPQVQEAYTEQGYDFSMSFEKVRTLITQSDLAIANFETSINESKKLSGYPRFNSPPEVLEGISKTGFDLMVTANNHCMDTGVEGAENTIELIKKNGMIPLGTGDKQYKSSIIDVNTIKLGVLAYTTTINGLKAPEGFVSMADEGQIKKDIDAIKDNCDFVIVYMHTGVEYARDVSEEQTRLFRAVADMGADCVLGSHPHVAQRSELYDTRGKKVLINYSMGNFLSNQNDKYTDVGTMTKLIIKKQSGATYLANFEIIPTYRLRFIDTDGKTKRRIILASDIDGYNHISERERQYIREVKYEVTKLLNEDEAEYFNLRDYN